MEFRTIGVIHTPFEHTEGMPIQPSGAKGIRGTVEVLPEFAEGLKDLDGFSHVTLIFHLHRAKEHRLVVVPFMDTEPRGVFATRAPSRPNPIGLSTVRLIAVRGNTLEIEGVDMLDGTPLLDIKPYVPEFDSETEITLGWLERHRGRSRRHRSDGRFR
jgi:tRNA-Thr(GGU) m(6)t(6)A37 methyltransferase TsaA